MGTHVLILVYMCPICVSSYMCVLILVYVCPRTSMRTCVPILVYVCPHTTKCVLILLCMLAPFFELLSHPMRPICTIFPGRKVHI